MLLKRLCTQRGSAEKRPALSGPDIVLVSLTRASLGTFRSPLWNSSPSRAHGSDGLVVGMDGVVPQSPLNADAEMPRCLSRSCARPCTCQGSRKKLRKKTVERKG